ncbi:MAG: ABC transporter ATP-binding protein [Bacteriovoracaceae bacterium]|nr:ABC transporter ATP-binding protein [Bacteriovoracaceae bacterium]
MVIQFHSVFKSFASPSEREGKISILNDLNWELAEGDDCAILGPSGSGKSTLLTLAAGLDFPDQGDVSIMNQKLKAFKGDSLIEFRAKNMGIIYQGHYLISSMTALENVMLSPVIQGMSEAKEMSVNILNEVGLSHRLNHFPSQLSGGECQRVAIARSLVHGPKIVLADEPSGSLDRDTGKKVMDLFFSLVNKKRITTILVTHDRHLAKSTKHQYELVSGQLQKIKL